MTVMDPRIAARRRQVAEHGARHRLRWVLAAAAVMLLALGGWWYLQSPYLAVERVEVSGAREAQVAAALAAAGLDEGMSVAMVRTDRVEAALLSDPWVRDAVVEIDFPHVINVTILEHVPLAAVSTSDGWRLVAVTGAVLAVADEAPAGLPRITGAPTVEPGSVLHDASTVGALAFVAALEGDLRPDVTVAVAPGGLRAEVGGTAVLLGPSIDAGAKAAAVGSLLAAGIDPGWSLDVSSPSRPALIPPALPAIPEPEVEAIIEAVPEGQGN